MATRMVVSRPIFSAICYVLLVAVVSTIADEAIDVGAEESHQRFVETVEESSESCFSEIVKRYDRYLSANPNDPIAATERCHFITYFVYSEDFYIESAEELLEKSEAYLDRFDDDPFVELYRLGELYGEDAISRAEKLLKNKKVDWSDEQLAEIHLTLARQYSYNKEPEASRKHAELSFEKHATADTQIIWGEALKDDSRRAAAIEVLSQRFPDEGIYQKRNRMNLLSELGDEGSAMTLLDELSEDADHLVNQFEIAQIYARGGQVEKARGAFSKAMENGWNKAEIAREAFALEKKYGDEESTLAAYNQLRDQGFGTDPLLRYRLGLVNDYPKLPWRARDLLSLLALAGCGIGLILFPLLFLVPIHHWGLIREKKGKTGLEWDPAWGMRRAWLVLAMYLVVTTAMNYLFGYEALIWSFSDDHNEEFPGLPGISLARIFLVGDMLVFLGLILCLGWGFHRAIPTTEWSTRKAIGLAFLIVFPVKILAGINESFLTVFQSTPAADASILTEMLSAALEHYGPLGLIFGVAIMTPIIEEVIFRGVMLTAITKYIPFAWANVLQAFAFMAVHENLEFFPFLFCFGLICGYLRKASGGLLPSILLHAFHNGSIALSLIFFAW